MQNTNFFRSTRRIVNRLIGLAGMASFGIIDQYRRVVGVKFVSTERLLELGDYEEQQRPARPVYLNVGSLDFMHPYWTNLDKVSAADERFSVYQQGNVHICYDLISDDPLPVPDGSLKIIYCSHVIEHIPNNDALHFFREAFRTLRPGGILRLVTPDFDRLWAAYHENDLNYLRITDHYGYTNREQLFVEHVATQLTEKYTDPRTRKVSNEQIRELMSTRTMEEALDYFASLVSKEVQLENPDNHCNWYNFAKLQRLLAEAGFTKIARSGYGQSRSQILRNTNLFDTTAPHYSLFVEAER